MLADLSVVFVTPRGPCCVFHQPAISPDGEFSPSSDWGFGFAQLAQSACRWIPMTWVKRAPPGDPYYFCDCPPCPFCFVWVEEIGHDPPESKKGCLTRIQPLLLPLLAIIAFALTVGITMRHESLRSAANELVAAATSLPARVQIPLAVQSTVAEPAGALSAASSSDSAVPTKTALPAAPASEPAPPEVPVAVVLSPTAAGGLYAVLENQSTEPLLVMLTISDRKGGHKYTTTLTVPPYSAAQLEGIAAERGDRITLASNGYRDQVTYFQ